MRNFRQKINEEVVGQPNNPKAPLLFVTQTILKANDDPKDKTTVPGVIIADKKRGVCDKPIFNANELDIIAQYCPKAVIQRGQAKMFLVQIKKPDFENGQGTQIIDDLAKGITATGDFGTVNASDIMNEVSNTLGGIIDNQGISNITQSTVSMLDNWLSNFEDPDVLAALAKIGVRTPFKGLCYELSMRNVMLIDSQNKERVAKGLPSATYLLSPTDWFSKFKRRLKPDASPIYYWAPAAVGYTLKDIQLGLNAVLGNPHPMNNQDMQSFYDLDNSTYFDIHRNVENNAKKAANPNPKYYNIYPYYDIQDTVLIDESDDPWNDSERVGVTNNIHPNGFATPAAQAAINQQYQDDAEAQQLINDKTGLVDDVKEAIASYNAIKFILDKKDAAKLPPITDQEGKTNNEAIKQSVFEGVKILAKKQLMTLYANEGNTEEKATVVACMYVAIHGISSQLAMGNLKRYQQQEIWTGNINGKEVRLTKGGNDENGKPVFYYKPSAYSQTTVYDTTKYPDPVKTGGLMDEVKRKCYELLNISDIVDGQIRKAKQVLSEMGKSQGQDAAAAKLAEAYMHNGTYEDMENSKAIMSFDQEMKQLYSNLQKWCQEGEGEDQQSAQSMKSANIESDDDWFSDDSKSGIAGLENEEEEPLQFDDNGEEDRQLAESKFYNLLNRINKLY